MEAPGSKVQCVALAGISNAALASADLPAALTLLQWGVNETDRGSFVVDERTAAAIARQREAGIYERVLIDFEHSSQKGHANFIPPPRKHGGTGLVFCDAERGLGIEQVAWTPSGQENAKEYPDLSPVIGFASDEKGSRVVTGLFSVALVPNGGVKGLSFFSAPFPTTTQPEEPDMDLAQLTQSLTALTEKVTALTEKVTALEAALGKLPAVEKLTALLADAPEGVGARIAALQAEHTAELAKRDKAALLAGATAQGKVVALDAAAVGKLSVEDLANHIAALPAGQVPLSARTPEGGKGDVPADRARAQLAAVESVKIRDKCSFEAAWNLAQKEKPELFG